jgi:hypothetical protein
MLRCQGRVKGSIPFTHSILIILSFQGVARSSFSFRRATSFLVALFLFIVPSNVFSKSSGDFLVGVLQEDGMLRPYADYDHGKWESVWQIPEPLDPGKVMMKDSMPLTSIPKSWIAPFQSALTIWYLNGKKEKPIHALNVAWMPIHCGRDYALLTDFPNRKPEAASVFPIDKIGITTTLPLNITTVDDKNLSADEVQSTSKFIEETFDAKEAKTGETKVKTKILKLMKNRSPIHDSTFFFFEAEREFPVDGNSKTICGKVDVLSGWAEENASKRLTLIQANLYKTDCDGMSAKWEIPFAFLSIDNHLYVLAQINGYEDEAYVVDEIFNDHLQRLIEAPNGSC